MDPEVMMHALSSTTQDRCILVIDDGSDNRLLLDAVLRRAGYRVLLAEDGEQGLKILDSEDPSLILLDYSMPGLSGPEVARLIRGRSRHVGVPIILLTASTEADHVDQAFAAGADDYVTKPFDRRILTARIESMIRAAEDRLRAKQSADVQEKHDRLLSELQEAARVQREQITPLPFRYQTGIISGTVVPCSHIGGDSLQIFSEGGITTAVLIDVSGHGAAAALVASAVVTELRGYVATHSLATCFAMINRQIASRWTSHYACIAAIQISANRATVINAGLPPVSHVRGGEIIERIEASGTPPGLLTTSYYDATELDFLCGDRLILMSDGLTEPLGATADDIQECVTRLGLLSLSSGHSSEALARSISSLFAGNELEDDASLLLVDHLG
ncbi:MAG: response regulator [Kofleriaceae bacterium]